MSNRLQQAKDRHNKDTRASNANGTVYVGHSSCMATPWLGWDYQEILVPTRAYILLRRRGHATPHMPVETAKCWWLLKIEPNAWAGGKGSCAVCVDLQAVGALEFFGELLAKGFGPFLRGVGRL